MSTKPTAVQKKAIFLGHRDCIYTLEKSVETNSFFSASGDGMVVKWEISEPENGELLARVPNSVYAIRLILTKNQMLIGQNFEGLHLIDIKTKNEIRSIKITESHIFDIEVFENMVFVACGNGEIIVLNLENFRIITSIKPTVKSARCIAINPLVNEFVVGFSDYYIRTYSLADFSLQKEWLAHKNSIFSLVFTPDFKYLLSSGRDAQIKIWDTWNHYDLYESIAAHIYATNSIAFSPDGTKFATGSMDKSVKIWGVEEWRLLKVVDKSRHAGHATSVNKVIWLDNTHLLSASDDKKVNLWEIN